MDNQFRRLPGEVFIAAGRDTTLGELSSSEVNVQFAGSDLYQLDAETGIVRQIDQQQRLIEWTSFSLDPNVVSNFHFDICCDFESMARIDAYLEQVLKNMPIDLADAEMSAAEIVHNAIKAAESDSIKYPIQVSLLSIPDFSILLIGITDKSGHLNLEKIKLGFSDVTNQELMSDHGRGLSIVAQLMAGLVYNPADDGYKEIFFFVPLKGRARHG